ncbi:hypothetical protein BCO26_1305 [Heyndrickxia coagulans 2-6]|jgi:hypothetical protein|nr:hypothetical protein BCO26_1305 [Heyndrickxia coagulans 2-6]
MEAAGNQDCAPPLLSAENPKTKVGHDFQAGFFRIENFRYNRDD